MLDAEGGTAILQIPPAHITIERGAEELACLRLTEKGLLRWYSRCCQTPIGNTMGSWNPSFVGLIHTCLGGAGGELERSFGPVTMRAHVESATGGQPKAGGLLGGMATILSFAAKARITGSYKATPFFARDSGRPVATPIVLTKEQLAAARP